MSMKTIAEKILSAKSARDVRAGDLVVCDVDCVLGTDASSPMAIDYFKQMGGERLFDASRVIFALDHYSPPSTARTAAFHDEVRAFSRRHGSTVLEVGEGISHQVIIERGRVRPGDLVIGADSHTVTCGALGAFAIGVGSSDLAAAMITGQVWLRVPESLKIVLVGDRPADLGAKDIALAIVGVLGADGASYQALEFHGPVAAALPLDDRLVLCNMAVEADAKAAVFPADDVTFAVPGMAGLDPGRGAVIAVPDAGASYAREITIDVSELSPRIALPHAPDNVVSIEQAVGTPVHMIFIGTCTGGRVGDFHDALEVIERAGGRIASGVQLVITPASRDVYLRLLDDGTMRKLAAMGAIITTPGCGACCGTSGVIPGDGMNVISTANRNFKARMGNATASIYLASPAACAAAAAVGHIVDPRTL